MRLALLCSLVLAAGGCAANPLSSIDPAKVPKLRAEPTRPILLVPAGWKQRYVPARFQNGSVSLVANFVKPKANARLFIWSDTGSQSPAEMAETLIAITIRANGVALRAEVSAPDAAVVLFDPVSGRGGYVIIRQVPDGSVLTFDADFPPEHAKEIIQDVTEIAAKSF